MPNATEIAISSKPSTRCSAIFTSGSLGCFQQTTATQQGIGLRLPAPEGDIGVLGIARAARRVDVVMQAFGYRRIEDVTRFLKGAERIGVHHLGPHVAIVARRIV